MSNSQNSNKNVTPSVSSQAGAWEHGWYVFEDGQVLGPLDAKSALGAEKSSTSGQARMVSRKGFTQWYPVRDFAEIYSMIGEYSSKLETAVQSSKKAANAYEPAGNMISPTVINEPPSYDVRPQEDLADTVMAARNLLNNKDFIDTEDSSTPASLNDHLEAVPTADFNEAVDASTESMDLTVVADAAVNSVTETATIQKTTIEKKSRRAKKREAKLARQAARNQNLMEPASFANQYLDVQSRLRLGRVFSPILGAIIYTPLTLGGYWWSWFVQSCDEVNWHLNGSTDSKNKMPKWLCMIPGIHLVAAYNLACSVRDMEKQNGYQTVKPFFAAITAIIPPLYIIVLQSALNRHWRLHVVHSGNNNN